MTRMGRCIELCSPAESADEESRRLPPTAIAPCARTAPRLTHQHTRMGETYQCGGAAYCERHGGEARAREEAEEQRTRCWDTLAPPHLSRAQVDAAGVMGLSSEHVYVVVRAQESGRWSAGLGVGGHYEDLRGSWEDVWNAELAAVVTWRRRVEARLFEIREARGGTLDWGFAVHALQRPRVIRFVHRGGNAWEQVDQAKPSVVDIDRRPMVGTNADERRALRRARAGERLRLPDDPELIREVVERARELGAPLEDEGALLVVASTHANRTSIKR